MAFDRGEKIPRLDPVDNPVPASPTLFPPPPDPTAIHVIKIVSTLLIIFLGVILNYVVIQTIVKHRKYHRAPWFHVISLCIADMGRCVLTLPLTLTSLLHHNTWIFSTPACKLSALANVTLSHAALFSVLAMAADRHISVVHHSYYERRVKEHRFFLSALLVWASALLMAFPPLFHFGDYSFSPLECQCTLQFAFLHNNDTLSFVLVSVLALGATAVVYSRVYVFMRAHRRMGPINYTPAASHDWTFFGPGATGQAMTNWMTGFGVGPPHPAVVGLRNQALMNRFHNLRSCKNEHLTRMFVLVTCVFGLLWLPYQASGAWRLFVPPTGVSDTFVTLSVWLTYVQPVCVPLIYITCNRSFRRAVTTKETLYIHGETGRVLAPES